MPGAQLKPASSWVQRLGLFYVLAVCIALSGAALLFYQIAKATPSDPSAIELSMARFAAHADYQAEPPAHLAAATVVLLPHRIDDKLRGPGGFYWYELDFTVLPDSRLEALYIPRFAMNAEVYLNGERIGYFGPMTGEYAERNWNRPQILNLSARVCSLAKIHWPFKCEPFPTIWRACLQFGWARMKTCARPTVLVTRCR